MAAPARVPLTPPPTLEAVDAELARWRARLAAASRNVSELSELPAFLAARQAAAGSGRMAAEARGLAATMDELWQGVLLIGAALDRAEAARRGGSRLWGGEAAAAAALAILDGPSITVELASSPVLHRGLLTGAREGAAVSPGTLLAAMTAAFDSARTQLARMAEGSERAAALHARLAAQAAALPGLWAAQLEGTGWADPLDRLDALEALRPGIEAAAQAQAGLAAAGQALAPLRAQVEAAVQAAAACRAATTAPLPALDPGALTELAAWLDRIGHTLAAGRVQACGIGLANWRALHDRTTADAQALAGAAAAALARRDELRARLGLLRAKRRAHPGRDAALAAPDAAAEAALAMAPCDLDAAAVALRAYQAALT